LLQIQDLHKSYGAVKALDGCTFTADRGRMLGFLGPNGAGKTTAMRTIFGLVTPDRGTVTWNGAKIGHEERMRFGYMPESRGLYPKMKVADQLTYLGRLHGMGADEAATAANELLDRLGLSDRARDQTEKLSHGNQQRVQLAAALVNEPELLVLDEPFSGLDPIGVATLAEVLAERAERSRTPLPCDISRSSWQTDWHRASTVSSSTSAPAKAIGSSYKFRPTST
jgi:ABC-2 type transport system ATP-binding protein